MPGRNQIGTESPGHSDQYFLRQTRSLGQEPDPVTAPTSIFISQGMKNGKNSNIKSYRKTDNAKILSEQFLLWFLQKFLH